jgi:hypothetical protein
VVRSSAASDVYKRQGLFSFFGKFFGTPHPESILL